MSVNSEIYLIGLAILIFLIITFLFIRKVSNNGKLKVKIEKVQDSSDLNISDEPHKNQQSFDFDIANPQMGEGEFFLAVRRFIPDFKNLQGNAKVTMAVKRFPQKSQTTTSLSPFTITSSTNKKDTRARGRYVNIKIENDAASESWRFGTLRLDVQPDGRR